MKTKNTTVAWKWAEGGTLGIPAGLRVKKITSGGTAGKFFLDELPASLFPLGSISRHDATYYGVILDPSQVE